MVKNTNLSIQCRGRILDFSKPLVMGILNLTPDSFYEKSRVEDEKDLFQTAEKMIIEGATFLDLGAYSSRPGADNIDEKTENDRLIPALNFLLKEFPEMLFSADTFRSEIAKSALDNGADLINDISGGSLDAEMMKTVGNYSVPYIMMHMRGTPQTMQSMTSYDNVVKEMLFYFSEKVAKARSLGINDLIIDPGFGFAKTLEQNYEVLQKMERFQIMELPLLAGFSRKSMIYKFLNSSAELALNGTTVLNTIALTKGAQILRVHDVKEAVECVNLFNKINK